MTIISEVDRETWNKSTGTLPWGLQRALLDALELCEQGSIKLVWGTDVHEGRPCLFNAVRNMTTQGDKAPATYAMDVVIAFDNINLAVRTSLDIRGFYVEPITAGWLVRNFGDLNPEPELTPLNALEFLDECDILNQSWVDEFSAWIANATEVTNGSPSDV
jgi:hypothetical protein